MTTIDQAMVILAARHDRFEDMLTRLGWPLPGHLGSKWLDDVAQLYLNGRATQDQVEDAILRSYRAHGLNDIRQSWQSDVLIAARLPILLDALKAHEEERYNLSVPVVLAQFEGMVAEARRHEGRFNRKNLVDYLEPITTSGNRFQRIAARVVVETLWAEFSHGAHSPPLSRHAILHGADIGYGTAANSLRAILYFDTIRKALSAKAA